MGKWESEQVSDLILVEFLVTPANKIITDTGKQNLHLGMFPPKRMFVPFCP